MQSHAQAPVVLSLGGSDHRIYFASRDADQRSHVSYVDLDITDRDATVEVAEAPALAPGPLGHFDDYGVYPSGLVQHEGRLHLYYIGWSPAKDRPLSYSSIGLAVSEDGGLTFERVRRAGVLGRSEEDPWMVTGPSVLVDADGTWRMWYVSGLKWERRPDGTLVPWYHVKSASSADGIEWEPDGRPCITHEHPGERNIGRPFVAREDGGYKAWYGHADDSGYRLGYAESRDGLEWSRLDSAVRLTGDSESWEEDRQTYPWIFNSQGERYMVYCGASLGRTGFGLAIEES
jgi:hypothetical protein